MKTEKQLIRDCRKGKKAGQFELVRRYSGMLMTVCRRYVDDEAMAKDILQETFIRIFKYIHTYKPTGSFEAWMRRIAVRCALQWLGKSHYKKEVPLLELSYTQFVEPEIYSQLRMEEIIKLIQELPTGFRTVFNLNIIDGYSHKEISEMLGITESTSRSQLVRARSWLQKKLNSNNTKNYWIA